MAVIELLPDNICTCNADQEIIMEKALHFIRGEQTSDSALRLLIDYLPLSPQRFIHVCVLEPVSSVTYMLMQGMNLYGEDMDKRFIHVGARPLNVEKVEAFINARRGHSKAGLIDTTLT